MIQDSTFDYGGFAGGYYLPYYAGIPTNPRFIYPFVFTDSAHTFTQEVRLVSKADPANMFDYVVGAFYENQTNKGLVRHHPRVTGTLGGRGMHRYGVLHDGSSSFPNCRVLSGPDDVTFQQIDTQNFTDKSVFGELTWHFMPHGQLTVGVRHYSQEFTDSQLYQDYTLHPGAANSV